MIVCEECHIGRRVQMDVPYLRQFGRQIMIVPRVPALVCDVCGTADYDSDVIYNLQSLLEQHTESSPTYSLAQRQLMLASRPGWLRPRRSI